MKHLGYINAEGGPLLIADADVVLFWNGTTGDGRDYARACEMFDTNANLEGGTISIGSGIGLLWEMKGPGTADAFIADHLVLIRTWPLNPDDLGIPEKLASEPLNSPHEIAIVHITTGRLAILWAAEGGECFRSANITVDGQPTCPLAIDSSALLCKVDPGIYRCLHDQLQSEVGVARRLHLVPLVTKPTSIN